MGMGVHVQCRVSISLPPACSPGDMLRDKQLVFSKAEEKGGRATSKSRMNPDEPQCSVRLS
jgi:hypothetical protein